MAEAKCLNENCERGVWTLRKRVEDYKGGVSCPDCGTTRVETSGGGQQRQGGQQLPQQQQQQGGQQPAPQGGGAVAGGLGALVAALDGDMPADQRAQGLQKAGGVLGNVARQLFEYRENKRQMAEQRAQEAELQESTLPRCENELPDGEPCGYQFGPEDIGLSDRVRCPRCETVYDISGV